MKRNYNKYIMIIICIVFIFGLGIIIYSSKYSKTKEVSFADREMKYIITREAYVEGVIDKDEEVKKENFDDIIELNLGYVSTYKTISDVEKCENLEYFTIGFEWGYYRNFDCDVPEPLDNNEIFVLQSELYDIFENCKYIKWFRFANIENTSDINSIEFLENAQNLELITLENLDVEDYGYIYNLEKLRYLGLVNCSINDLKGIEALEKKLDTLILVNVEVLDYSPIYNLSELTSLSIQDCNIEELDGIEALSKLEKLYLDGTNINSAETIIKLEDLKQLHIVKTPLAENEEELQKIYDKFPNIRIITE